MWAGKDEVVRCAPRELPSVGVRLDNGRAVLGLHGASVETKAACGWYRVVVSGGGMCRVGVSQTPFYQFRHEIDGAIDIDRVGITTQSIVTNEWAMVTWRWGCVDGVVEYRSDIGRLHAYDDLAIVRTNGVCSALSGSGVYMVGLTGLHAVPPYDVEWFDARVFTRWVEQGEMERIHLNGVQELIRRGMLE